MMLYRFACVVLLAGSCAAQDTARMDQVVDSYVKSRQFMGTVLVGRGDAVLFSKAYGSADLEWNAPNAPNTRFRIGSITKQFTAALILQLKEQGKLDLHDPVKKHMADAPAAWDKVTIFHLLTHTSGIPSFTGFPDYRTLKLAPATARELVARFKDKPLEFEPGEKWKYSNSGYVLLTFLLENITGEKYAKLVNERIFAPLGMKDSGYDSNTAIIPRRASGYTPNGKGELENAAYVDMTVPQGAGGLYSTTEDLFRWEQALFGGKVVTPESLREMTTPFKNDYGFGLSIHKMAGHNVIDHGGGIEGFNTELEYYPDDKLTVIALSNVNGGAPGQIASRLALVAMGEKVVLPSERKEITVDVKTLRRYAGTYRLGPPVNANLQITLEGNQLSAKLANQPAFPIFPEAERNFFLKVVDAQLEFSNEEPEAKQVTLHQNGASIAGKRLDAADADK